MEKEEEMIETKPKLEKEKRDKMKGKVVLEEEEDQKEATEIPETKGPIKTLVALKMYVADKLQKEEMTEETEIMKEMTGEMTGEKTGEWVIEDQEKRSNLIAGQSKDTEKVSL